MIAAALVVKSAPGMSRREKATAQVVPLAGATTIIFFRRRRQSDSTFINVLLARYMTDENRFTSVKNRLPHA